MHANPFIICGKTAVLLLLLLFTTGQAKTREITAWQARALHAWIFQRAVVVLSV